MSVKGPLPLDVTSMSVEELQDSLNQKLVLEACRAKRYYQNNIKTDPEKYQKYLDKCKRNNKARYERMKKTESPEIQALKIL
jgi:hypothetical protein